MNHLEQSKHLGPMKKLKIHTILISLLYAKYCTIYSIEAQWMGVVFLHQRLSVGAGTVTGPELVSFAHLVELWWNLDLNLRPDSQSRMFSIIAHLSHGHRLLPFVISKYLVQWSVHCRLPVNVYWLNVCRIIDEEAGLLSDLSWFHGSIPDSGGGPRRGGASW